MSLISRVRRQDAVYWPPTGKDRFGQTTFGAPRPLRVRWVQGVDENITSDSSEVTVGAVAFVGETLVVGGMLYLGVVADIDTDGRPHADAKEIIQFTTVPNIKNTESLMIAKM